MKHILKYDTVKQKKTIENILYMLPEIDLWISVGPPDVNPVLVELLI